MTEREPTYADMLALLEAISRKLDRLIEELTK